MSEKSKSWKPYVGFILLTEAVGGLSAWLTRDGMKTYQASAVKPSLSPPPAVFPVVWGVLFALMGVGAARVWQAEPSKERTQGLWLFGAQLIMNFTWSLLFFNRQAFGFAFWWLVVLWILILLMTVAFGKADKAAGLLQIPYLIWVAFAGYLNAATWSLNG
jgi:benzodiazapine receptor